MSKFITVLNPQDNGIYRINLDNVTYVYEDLDEKDLTIYLSTEENDTIIIDDPVVQQDFLSKLQAN